MTTGDGRRRGKGCLGVWLLLLLLAAAAWIGRDAIGDWMGRLELGDAAEVSEQLASRAEEKLNRVFREGLREEMRLSEAELQSLLTYRAETVLPGGIEDPRIDVQDSLIVLSARLRPEDLDGYAVPDALSSALADTSRVIAGLAPEIEQPGELQLRVRSLQIGAFVIPPVMLPAVVGSLQAQGVRTAGGAVALDLSRDVGAVRLEGDDVVLVPRRADEP